MAVPASAIGPPSTTAGPHCAIDRLLARVFSSPSAHRWALRGSAAVWMQAAPSCRSPDDVDLFWIGGGDIADARAALERAVLTLIPDGYRFACQNRMPIERGFRREFVAEYAGDTSAVRVDVAMTRPLTDAFSEHVVEDLVVGRYIVRAVSIVDHLADKFCGIHQVRSCSSRPPIPSARYKDLVDLVCIVRSWGFEASLLARAVRREAAQSGVSLPESFTIPDRSGWERGYPAAATAVPWLPDQALDCAHRTAARCFDPILARSATGTWDPSRLVWAPSSQH